MRFATLLRNRVWRIVDHHLYSTHATRRFTHILMGNCHETTRNWVMKLSLLQQLLHFKRDLYHHSKPVFAGWTDFLLESSFSACSLPCFEMLVGL